MATQTSTAVQTYAVDPSHSQVQFAVRHLGFSKVRGRFGTFEGTVRLDPSNLETLEVEGAVDASSIDTREEKRDAHLRSGDFFESDRFKNLTFRSTGVKKVEGNHIEITGDLTVRDVTKQIVLKGEFLGEATDPWGGKRVAFEASTKVNRKEFGLNWNTVLETGGFLVGDDVEISLEVQAVQQ